LIICALSDSHFPIEGLSTSDDTSILAELLKSDNLTSYDVHHAGTSFRFLTAYLTLQPGTKILTGSQRMLQRPIGPLVDALRKLGASIDYLGKEGYPPLKIAETKKWKNEVAIKANISSQYLTALILIAPALPDGLKIQLKGDLVSESYLQMTLDTVREFGIKAKFKNGIISITPQRYQPKAYRIEADWSAASYHFSMIALAKSGTIDLTGLFEHSYQGDAAIIDFSTAFGTAAKFMNGTWHLSKCEHTKAFVYDFINQPDIAQTVAVICAAKGIKTQFTGLQTLSIKETDRITALDAELQKVGCRFVPSETPESYTIVGDLSFKNTPRFATYKDHRMAMAFAPLALLHPIEMEEPEVVSKSYPNYWEDLEKLGFKIENVEG
jgi:3-phosphoshikimate 1-carboxyvinyltransferase